MEEQKQKEAKENANPRILQKSKQYAQKFQQENKPIEERLIGYKKRVEGKKQ